MKSMLNKKIIAVLALAVTLLLGGCSSTSNKSDADSKDKTNVATTSDSSNTTSKNSSDSNSNQSSTDNSSKNSQSKQKPSSSTNSEESIAGRVKDYINNGQVNKSEAEKLKWSKTFLEKVDIDSLYKKYLANGGKVGDVENFALYMTQNAPIPSDWQDMFKKDLLDTYGEKVTRVAKLQDDKYQAYVEKDGKEVPYVVVSARTGYFHG